MCYYEMSQLSRLKLAVSVNCVKKREMIGSELQVQGQPHNVTHYQLILYISVSGSKPLFPVSALIDRDCWPIRNKESLTYGYDNQN